MVAAVLLVVGFALMVGGALVFTNAIEWAGVRLGLGHGAVGSVLAGVATAMPESLIPVVAVIEGRQAGGIAVGAIVGAPFLLATLALAVAGGAALAYRARRGTAGLHPDRRAAARDLVPVLCALPVAMVTGLIDVPAARYGGAAVLLAAYAVITWRTVAAGRQEGGGEEPARLYFAPAKQAAPTTVQVLAQVVTGLGLLVGAAQLFVSSTERLAHGLGADELTLTLIIAPLATELPEALNSVVWIRQGKDTLALGNITGALIFQSMPLVAFGMVFTRWQLTAPALAAMAAAVAGAAYSLVVVRQAGRWRVPFLGGWAGLYLGGVASVIALS